MGLSLNRIFLKIHARRLVPKVLRKLILQNMLLLDLRRANWMSNEKCDQKLADESQYPSQYVHRLGIIKEFWGAHSRFILACQDLGVSYKVLDISGPDWKNVIGKSECQAFLVYPSIEFGAWKQMYDERLRLLAGDMGKLLFPSYEELWLLDSKRRVCYWLQANEIPHPKTWIFYQENEALEFASQAQLPIVSKSNRGAGSSGVVVFRRREALLKHIKGCFRKGYTNYRLGNLNREWGCVLLQEYVPNAREWRVIRIGDSYFGYEKLKVGDFHSGSHSWKYSRPADSLLDFARQVTTKGRFSSMDLDIFVTSDGRYLVSELQALFAMGHPYEMCVVDGQPGRMVTRDINNTWLFEPGSFCQNHLCNLRVLTLLNMVEARNV
jgi:hypothetical protein